MVLAVLTYVQPSAAAVCSHQQEGVEFQLRDNPLRGRLKIEIVHPGLPAIRTELILTATNSRLAPVADGYEVSGGAYSDIQVFRIRGFARLVSTGGYSGRITIYLKTADGEFQVEDAELTCR